MNLLDVIRDLDSFDEEHTIYAQQPWRPASMAIVVQEPPVRPAPGMKLMFDAPGTGLVPG